MYRDQIEEIVKKIQFLPPFSAAVKKLMEVASDEDCLTSDIAKAISADPAMASNVLNLVNSSFYGFQNKITSINRAVIVLGQKAIKNLAFCFAVFENFKKSKCCFDPEIFWYHSLSSGLIAQHLAKINKYPNPEETFSIALLHDIGFMVLNIIIPERFERFYNKPIYQHTLKEEKEIFGITHAETGALLLEHWNFPESFCTVIRNHHCAEYVDSTNKNLLDIVKLSDILSYIAGRALIDKHPGKNFFRASKSLNISVEELGSIFFNFEKQLYDIVSFFNITAHDPEPNVNDDIFNTISIASSDQLILSWLKIVLNYFGYNTDPIFIFPDDNKISTSNKALLVDISKLPLSQFKNIADYTRQTDTYLIMFGKNNDYSDIKYPRLPFIFSKKEFNALLEGNFDLVSL